MLYDARARGGLIDTKARGPYTFSYIGAKEHSLHGVERHGKGREGQKLLRSR